MKRSESTPGVICLVQRVDFELIDILPCGGCPALHQQDFHNKAQGFLFLYAGLVGQGQMDVLHDAWQDVLGEDSGGD